ncbi:hypothetical protein [Lewinella cohaerens]|uniref:hypothetical protein n=1 Tax=Lewinella cohaerens TaxID=70995 RepID=UPI0003623C37|nr:hypothetical protein [Lewinella cohaerens]
MITRTIGLSLCLSIVFLTTGKAQQVPDTSTFFVIDKMTYPDKDGPLIYVDAGHNNFHTLAGRYVAFGNVLAADGYQLADQPDEITPAVLEKCEVYVIANPLHESNVGNWENPCLSAFSEQEITALKNWVAEGGCLFLIADHMPFGGAAKDLGAAFGVEWLNCFAMDNRRRSADRFSHKRGNLGKVGVTENISMVVTFTGSAFKAPATASVVVGLDENFTLLSPAVAWQFDDDSLYEPGAGWQQLAYFPYEKGKVVVSGEAAMFSAQLSGPREQKVGMNSELAKENVQLLRNLVSWLVD